MHWQTRQNKNINLSTCVPLHPPPHPKGYNTLRAIEPCSLRTLTVQSLEYQIEILHYCHHIFFHRTKQFKYLQKIHKLIRVWISSILSVQNSIYSFLVQYLLNPRWHYQESLTIRFQTNYLERCIHCTIPKQHWETLEYSAVAHPSINLLDPLKLSAYILGTGLTSSQVGALVSSLYFLHDLLFRLFVNRTDHWGSCRQENISNLQTQKLLVITNK